MRLILYKYVKIFHLFYFQFLLLNIQLIVLLFFQPFFFYFIKNNTFKFFLLFYFFYLPKIKLKKKLWNFFNFFSILQTNIKIS
jgi:hypothetical protein